MNITLNTECQSCEGTGLYSGFMEGKGDAVICVSCGGTGCRKIDVKKFTGRKKRKDVSRVRAGSGTILDTPTSASWISYSEFESKIPAPKSEA